MAHPVLHKLQATEHQDQTHGNIVLLNGFGMFATSLGHSRVVKRQIVSRCVCSVDEVAEGLLKTLRRGIARLPRREAAGFFTLRTRPFKSLTNSAIFRLRMPLPSESRNLPEKSAHAL